MAGGVDDRASTDRYPGRARRRALQPPQVRRMDVDLRGTQVWSLKPTLALLYT